MMIKVLRFIIGFLLIPLCIAVTVSFYKGIVSIKNISGSGLIFLLGVVSYSILHILLFKLDFLYILGHELMHAIATFFSGGKVLSFKVSSKGGNIKTSASPNFFVILAPYLIPGYTVFVVFLYFIFSLFMDVTRYSELFMFFVGFTLMFHLAHTAQSVKEKQSDLIKTGYLFSISSVYIINLIFVFFIVSMLFREASFFDFFSGSYEKARHFYYSFWKQLFM
ncbi:hypothetical protein ACFL0P_03870 [Candidatus Omnitrophota bacterium]